MGGVALNVAVLLWHPDRWGIATAAIAASTSALLMLWFVSMMLLGRLMS